MKEKILGLWNNARTYWKIPMPGRYMTFKEIAAYSFGGIGAYFIIQLGSTLIVSTTNTIVSTAIGVSPRHSYIIYLIATLLNIPLTGIRANMVDNTRGKGGKYRPYLLSMGIPTALTALVYVWFPYKSMYSLFPGSVFGYEKGYLIKLAVVFTCNLALYFFFNFFRDAYENLIHVLSPNTQERTDVLAVKAVVYSLAPSIMNALNPIIAQLVAGNDQTNILVYRITYPFYAVIGIGLTIVVWANTKEKIVQAKTHTVQVRFTDALREVAKNKYFWIISLAGWLGFLELAYGNILLYYQSYAMDAKGEHIIEGGPYALAITVIGNASLWGMLFAPFFIKRFGKKKVLVSVNLMNVACILLMLVNFRSFWWLVICIWINYLFGSVEQITTPAIQADIRDYQQYRSGERIDGMFAAVATIGGVVTLATSAVLPAVQEKYGIFEGNGYEKPFDILNTYSGESGLLYKFLPVLIIMAAVGAFLNVVPYFFYDFTEKKQKGIVRVLKVRALFEDYGNGMLEDGKLVEAIDIIRNAEVTSKTSVKPKEKLNNSFLKIFGNIIICVIFAIICGCLLKGTTMLVSWLASAKDLVLSKPMAVIEQAAAVIISVALFVLMTDVWDGICAKKQNRKSNKETRRTNREAKEYNEEIEVSRFVTDELNKFDTDLMKTQVSVYSDIFTNGLEGLKRIDRNACAQKLVQLKQLPQSTKEEKDVKKFLVGIEKRKISCSKAIEKYYKDEEFVQPDFSVLEEYFDKEDECSLKIKQLYTEEKAAKKCGNAEKAAELKSRITTLRAELKDIQAAQKNEMDKHAYFGRAAKLYIDAKRTTEQFENYKHLDEISALYDGAKKRCEEKAAADAEEAKRLKAEEDAMAKKIKLEKERQKAEKKNKKR